MKRSFITHKTMLIFVAALLVLSSLAKTPIADAISERPRNIVDAATAPFRRGIFKVTSSLRKSPDLGVDFSKMRLEEEYLELRTLNEKLEYDLRQARETIAQMTALKQTMTTIVGKPLPADVIGSSGGEFVRALTINRGERDGVKKGMVVVSGYALVGRVADVGPVTSRVMLINDDSRGPLGVNISPLTPTNPPRSLASWAKVSPRGDEFWVEAGKDAGVQVEDLAKVSDETWPREARGFVVGKVVRVEKLPENPLLQERVVIQPTKSLASLTQVAVILPDGAKP